MQEYKSSALKFGYNLPINELAEMLIRTEKETVPDFITAFSDFLRQVGGVNNNLHFLVGD